MHALTILLFVSIFALPSSFATALISVKDTLVIPKTAHNFNKSQFLSQYAIDDSSRALILYYFYKRKKAVQFMYVPLSISMGAAAFSLLALWVLVFELFWLPVFLLIAVAYANVVLAIVGFVELIVFSRRLIIKRLNNYFAGKSIPRRIARSQVFYQFLSDNELHKYRRPPHFTHHTRMHPYDDRENGY
jgi:hypothetical protein